MKNRTTINVKGMSM